MSGAISTIERPGSACSAARHELPNVGAGAGQDLHDLRFRHAKDAEQDVLGANEVVTHIERLPQAGLERRLRAGREGDRPRRRRVDLAHDGADLVADGVEVETRLVQYPRGDTRLLPHQTQQQVRGADVVMAEHAGLVLRQHDHLPGPLGEPLEHA